MTEKRFVRKGYKIWDTWEDEEVYELHYRYEVDDMCDLMNEMIDENEELKQQLQKIQDSFEFSMTKNYEEIDRDKLFIKDMNTKICLDCENLFIEVYIPQTNESYSFKYRVTAKSLLREFIENYNSK